MKKLYEQETLAHKDDALVKQYKKQAKMNKIWWIVGASVALITTVVVAVVCAINKLPMPNPYVIAVVIPALVTVVCTVMAIVVCLGNDVAVKTYKKDKITFYSGPWTNILYINDKLIYKGSNENKLVGELSDKSLAKVWLSTIKFRIDILPPGSDPITGAKKGAKPEAKKPEEKKAK